MRYYSIARLPDLLPGVFYQASWPIHRYPFIQLVGGGSLREEYFAKEQSTLMQPGLEPRPFDPESSTQTIRPQCTRYFLVSHRQNWPSNPCLKLKMFVNSIVCDAN